MGYKQRKDLYEEYEKISKKPLISYCVSLRNGFPSQMETGIFPKLVDVIRKIKSRTNKQEIDFLIISNGGDPLISWKIIQYLKENFKKINILVPYVAFSAATILSLGGDSIEMTSFSNLGPIDSQISFVDRARGKGLSFSTEDIYQYLDYFEGKNCDPNILLQGLLSQVDSITLGFSIKSSKLGKNMADKLLSRTFTDAKVRNEMIKKLNSEYYNHGYPINRSEAKNIGLNIIYTNKEKEEILWRFYNQFDKDTKSSETFNPMEYIKFDDNPDIYTEEAICDFIESKDISFYRNYTIKVFRRDKSEIGNAISKTDFIKEE